MVNFILIFFCMTAGIIVSRLNILPPLSYKSINSWILYAALPALALRFVPEIHWSWEMLLPGLGPILVWLGAWLLVFIYGRKKGLDKPTRTALLITCGLGNTAFLGFPLVTAYYGEGAIRNAIVFDQVTFLLFSTVAIITVLRASHEPASKPGFKVVLKKILRFPPFLACMTALIIPPFTDISVINPFLDKLVATMSPLALFSIGLQLKLGEWKQDMGTLSVGLFYKLLIAPAIVLLLAFCLGSHDELARISVFEAAMPSHITASLLASQYNLNPKLCSLMVGIGIIAGFITTFLWWSLFQLI